jgi:antitoxin component YwqK of YwqJK toxin-antitoxin module
LATGQFLDGKPHGAWIHNDHEGKLVTSCQYQNGLLHGTMLQKNRAGNTDKIHYNHGKLLSRIYQSDTKYFTEENKIDSSVLGNLMVFKTTYKNGQIIRITSNWQLPYWMNVSGSDGPYMEADTSGRITKKGTYLMGTKVGEWSEWDKKSVQLVSRTYPLPTIPSTDFYFFHENGQLAVAGNSINMQPDGVWNHYNDQGQLIWQTHYAGGIKQGEEVQYHAYQQNYYLYASQTYQNNQITGVSTTFFQTGEPRTIDHYENGVQVGLSIEYAKPGIILKKINYQKGRMTGDIQLNNSDGTPKLTGTLDNGVLQGAVTESETNYLPRQQPTSSIMWTGQYKNGLRVGEWSSFDAKGNKLSTLRPQKGCYSTYASSVRGCMTD